MTVLTEMTIQLAPGTRDAAIKAFRERRVFEECAETIPGFIQAFFLADHNDPNAVCVISEWQSAQDYHDWVRSPVRAAQEQDFTPFVAAPPIIRMLERHL